MKPTDEEVERLARAAREAEIARGIRHSKPWYPDDDPRWQEFTPGDPMPCEPDMEVEVLVRYKLGAATVAWELEIGSPCVVAWRPA